MKSTTLRKLLSLLFAFGLVAAACGGDSDEDAGTDAGGDDSAEDGEAVDDGEAIDDEEGEAMDDESTALDSLVDVCPSPLVIQTDWFPEAEHGAMYEMLGDDYTVDAEDKVVRGSMVDGGIETGIQWEVRTGGPAIGFAPVASHVYTDDSIHLGYQNTEAQILGFTDVPMLAVMAPLEKNPQMVMWDPETYPEVETLADLKEAGATVNVFGGGVFSQVFVAQGIWDEDQVDPSYDGSPASFIASNGEIAQQGFASAEPHNYENVFEEWGKPVRYQLLHDSGFEVYSQQIAIKPTDQDALDDCLKEVVPIIQRAVVSYAADPGRANAIIIDAVDLYGDSWVYDEALAEFSIAAQRDLELVGNGPNDTVGDIEADRVQSVIDLMTDAGMDVPQVVADDLFTNEYIDDTIGF